MKTFEELKQEAAKLGVVPGAVVQFKNHPSFTVPEYDRWMLFASGAMAWMESTGAPHGFCYLYSPDGNYTPKVTTPAPEDHPQGLVDGMACEPDEHMRRAIVEKAKEFGNKGPAKYTLKYLVWYKETMLWQSDGCKRYLIVSPGEFYDRLCKTPKPEPPIRIGDHEVRFNKGSIQVGCTAIPNDIVRKVAERLKD